MGGVAARVEEMAAARNLRMEGGGLQHLGKREEGRWGEGGSQRREEGRLPIRGLKRGGI
jgi:hypothetical protein